ncbi:methyltransferase domain-containing protein [Actinobacteria bacterium YIM 96077]|uniref:MFS transporter n=1 Tax=Phytoactinopolyspora halophila TaxID=1981511 RepID=A0A329R4P7_9ACTN|nr:methyltransferase domain-containing protein [Actinobacteria bacterium YIM 96077]RAW18999.1 MFS transporter [Phytoactinopolyspora halophila]
MSGRGEHYFSARPRAASRTSTVRLELTDLDIQLQTDSGIFSHGRLDPGTKILLERAPLPRVRGDILDLGCGYGPIALALASRRKRARVWAVDVNERAVVLTRQNAEALGRGNVFSRMPDEVPGDVRFAAIYSNPPIRIGKKALHELLLSWLARLLPGGSAVLVVHKHLGSDSLARWLDGQGFPTTRLLSERGYRLLEVRPADEGPAT